MSLRDARCVCPGGMMTCSSSELMRLAGYGPDVHDDPSVMAHVAVSLAREAGFDNIGLPLCMTVEAEALGAPVDLGSADVEPSIARYIAASAHEVAALEEPDPTKTGRMPVVLEAIRSARDAADGRLVTGGVVGPMSLVTSLMDAVTFYRELAAMPEAAAAALELCTRVASTFAIAQVDAGAEAILIAEPSGTGDILGPEWFGRFVAPHLTRVSSGVLAAGAEVIVHICGDVRPITTIVKGIPMTAFSFDSRVSVEAVREAWPEATLMGNVSTHLLQQASPHVVESTVRGLRQRGIDVVAPACGISTTTPAGNVRAMTAAARS